MGKVRAFLHKKAIVSLLLSFFAFQLTRGFFVPRFIETERNVYIEATGKQNSQSKSNGVQIKEILLNENQYVLPVDFFELSSWEPEDNGALTWNIWKNRNRVVSVDKKFRSLRIGFTKEGYSGIAKVYVDNILIQEVDLYSKETETVFVNIDGVSKDTTGIYILKSLLFFVLLFLMCYAVCHLCQRSVGVPQNQMISGYSVALATSLVYVICFSKDIRIIPVLLRFICIFGLISVIWMNFIDWECFAQMDKRKYKRFFFAVGMLICILAPTAYVVNVNRVIQEEINNPTENIGRLSLVPGTVIKQNLNVQGQSQYAYIQIENKEDNTGNFTIRVVQRQKEIEWKMQGVDCNNKDSIPLDLSDLSPGAFSLYIVAQEGEGEESVVVLTSDQVRFGLLEENGETLGNKNLLMSLELSKERDYYKQQIVLFILLTVVLVAVMINVSRDRHNDKVTFVFVTVSTFLLCCIKNPTYFLDAQPIFETGSNFFLQTYERGFWKSLFLEDFVYLPLFTRLISDIIVLLFHQRKWAMLLLNGMGGMIVALNCGWINLKIFRINLGKYERLMLSLVFGLSSLFNFAPLFSLHNSGYWNFILLTLIFTVDWNGLKRYQYVLILFSTVMILSKISFITLFPIYLAILGFLLVTREIRQQKRLVIYLVLGICMIIISIGYTYNLISKGGYFVNHETVFGERILNVIKQTPLYYYRTLYTPIMYIFREQVINPYIFMVILLMLTVFVFVWLCTNALKKYRQNKEIIDAQEELIMILYLFLSYLTAAFLVYTDQETSLSIGTLLSASFPYERKNFIILIEIVFFLSMILRYICKHKDVRIGIMVCFAVGLFLLPFSVESNSWMLTDWSKYYKELYRSNYVIPVQTGIDLFVQKNAFAGYIGGDDSRYTGEYNFIYSAKTIKEIDADKIIYAVELSDADKLKDRDILEIYARKNAVLQSSESYVLIKDRDGNLIGRVDATFSEDRQSIGYILPDGIKNIGSLEFYYRSDNAPYPLLPEIYLGIEGEYEE